MTITTWLWKILCRFKTWIVLSRFRDRPVTNLPIGNWFSLASILYEIAIVPIGSSDVRSKLHNPSWSITLALKISNSDIWNTCQEDATTRVVQVRRGPFNVIPRTIFQATGLGEQDFWGSLTGEEIWFQVQVQSTSSCKISGQSLWAI